MRREEKKVLKFLEYEVILTNILEFSTITY